MRTVKNFENVLLIKKESVKHEEFFMKCFAKSVLSLTLLCGIALVQSVNGECCAPSTRSKSCKCTPHTIFLPRSVGANVAREMLPYAHQFTDCFNGGFGASVGYQRTYDGSRIARCLFGRETITFKGSLFDDRADDTTSLLADYFGMSTNSVASISFKPHIQNCIVDFNLYLGFDECLNGLYFRVHAPLAWTQWSLKSDCSCRCSDSCVPATTTLDDTVFPAGYMNTITALPTQEAPQTIAPVSTLELALDGQTAFGDKTRPWVFGRFGTCTDRSDWKIADVDLILGWNFWHCDDYHVGVYAQAIVPTGTKIDAEFQHRVFSPVIGNGKHWELGGGVSAHAQLWNCEDRESLTMYFEGNLTHMLKNDQVRSFDFTGKGAMSRYMLLKEFNTNNQYSGHLVNAIDYATRCTRVSIGVKGDAALKLVYSNCNWNLGLGYNFYGSSREQVCIGETASNLTGLYGFKGIAAADTLGYVIPAGDTSIPVDEAPTTSHSMINGYGLSSTQSDATIYGPAEGTLPDRAVPLWKASTALLPGFGYTFPLIPSLEAVQSATGTAVIFQTGLVEGLILAPELINASLLDKHSGAAARQMVSKLFGTLGYSWNECDWKPFLDLGVEWDLAGSKDCCSAKQWGLWLKGGISF